jgi:predicted enzyme related to lactoylglutathione lyase
VFLQLNRPITVNYPLAFRNLTGKNPPKMNHVIAGGETMAGSVTETATPMRWSVAPCFIVDDVVMTANFYRDQLGFRYDRFWGDPPCFCMVHRGGIILMLNQLSGGKMRPNRLADPNGDAWDAYVWVDDADALCREFKTKDVKIARELCDQPYGNRDFDIEDCNGYRLCFGHNIE